MGGAGKTPVALKLASMLREAGRKPGFLTRGYGGSERGPYLIDSATDGADRVGDEPLLLARSAPTVVSRDRPAGAKLLETLGVDAIIMDDGFQNPSLEKDFSVAVVDGGAGIGCGRVFPLGPLRARLAFQLGMADAVVILGAQDRTNVAELIEQKSQQFRSTPLPVFSARIVPAVSGRTSRPAFPRLLRDRQARQVLRHLAGGGHRCREKPKLPRSPSLFRQPMRYHSWLMQMRSMLGSLRQKRIMPGSEAAEGPLGELFGSAVALPIDVEFSEGGEARLMHVSRPHCHPGTALRRIRDRQNERRILKIPDNACGVSGMTV